MFIARLSKVPDPPSQWPVLFARVVSMFWIKLLLPPFLTLFFLFFPPQLCFSLLLCVRRMDIIKLFFPTGWRSRAIVLTGRWSSIPFLLCFHDLSLYLFFLTPLVKCMVCPIHVLDRGKVFCCILKGILYRRKPGSLALASRAFSFFFQVPPP